MPLPLIDPVAVLLAPIVRGIAPFGRARRPGADPQRASTNPGKSNLSKVEARNAANILNHDLAKSEPEIAR